MLAAYKMDMHRRGLTPASITTIMGRLRAFERWCDPAPVLNATPETIEAFLDARRIGPRTRYGYLSLLHGYYQWAIAHGQTDTDPTSCIIRPKLRRTLPRPVSDDELARTLELADPERRAWFTLAAFAGLRAGEIAGLHRDDVRRDLGMLRVLGKGQRERMVPIHPKVDAALGRLGPGPIFRRPQGGAWPPARLSRSAAVFLDDIGIDATLHQYRHWFGTRTYAACKDIRVVQELMGHSSPATSAIYIAFSEQGGRDAVEALELGMLRSVA